MKHKGSELTRPFARHQVVQVTWWNHWGAYPSGLDADSPPHSLLAEREGEGGGGGEQVAQSMRQTWRVGGWTIPSC